MNLSNIFKTKELPRNYEWELKIVQKILTTVNPNYPKLINDGTAYQERDLENRE